MKKSYIKPVMREVRIHRSQILCASRKSIKSVSNSTKQDYNLDWDEDGLEDGETDV